MLTAQEVEELSMLNDILDNGTATDEEIRRRIELIRKMG